MDLSDSEAYDAFRQEVQRFLSAHWPPVASPSRTSRITSDSAFRVARNTGSSAFAPPAALLNPPAMLLLGALLSLAGSRRIRSGSANHRAKISWHRHWVALAEGYSLKLPVGIDTLHAIGVGSPFLLLCTPVCRKQAEPCDVFLILCSLAGGGLASRFWMGQESTLPPRVFWARMLTLVGVSAFMLFGPFYIQVLSGSTMGKIFRPWVMFHTRGSDMCAVTFVLRSADGRERRIDYLSELGYGSWRTSKKKYKRINSKGEAQRLARKLCRRLERGGSVDLRLHLKCGSEDGWEPIYSGEKNACKQ